MDLPKKYGNMYIKFNGDNQPVYGFMVEGNCIKKFIKLSDDCIDTIILPKLVESEAFEMPDFEDKNKSELLRNIDKQILRDYASGSVRICDGAFCGIQKAKIVVPFENSVMIDWGSFDKKAQIEFVVCENLTFKQVYRTFDTGFEYEHENWTIIADKNSNCDFSFGGFCGDAYSIEDYDETQLDFTVAKFTTEKVKALTNECIK